MISWSSCTAFRRSHPAYHQGILTSRCCPGMCPRGWVFVSYLNLGSDATWPGHCQTELWWYQQRLEASGDEMSMLLVMVYAHVASLHWTRSSYMCLQERATNMFLFVRELWIRLLFRPLIEFALLPLWCFHD
jgi:hypothetical protein